MHGILGVDNHLTIKPL